MMVGSIGNYSYNPYSNNPLKSSASANNAEQSTNAIEATQSKQRRPQGPPPAGGPKGGKGPNLDTNNDDSWSVDEVDSFISETESSLDVTEFFDEYDVNEDGMIDSSEREGVAKNNGLELSMPPRMDFAQSEDLSSLDFSTSNYDSSILDKMMTAYTSNSAEYQQATYSADFTNMFA